VLSQAICEDELPLPVAGFSEHFNDFICHCLTRDKDHRPSARDLLQHAFIAPLHCTETDSEPSSAKTARVGTTKSTPLSGSKMATIDENEGVGDEPDAAPRAAQEDSLRLEHLDRILEAIKRKLEQAEMHTQLRSTRHSTDGDQTCCSRYTKEQIFRLSRPPSSGADAYTLSVSGPESFAYTGGSTNDGDSMSPLATSRDSNKWTHLALQLGLKCSIVYDRAREELFAHRRGRLN
jgi:serine/threonine protein kinase